MMIYLFNQENTLCVGFSDNPILQITANKIVLVNQNNVVNLATYEKKEDCHEVMEYLKKKIRLHENEFTFPTQDYVDNCLKK